MRAPKTTPELHEDVEREQGAHERVRHVHDLADAQVGCSTADRVVLLTVEAAGSEVFDHVQQHIPSSEGKDFALVRTVLPDGSSVQKELDKMPMYAFVCEGCGPFEQLRGFE